MAKADLHIHSKFSEHLSEEFLRKIGAAESYTEPEYIYKTAKERGMSFVTITDHNKIDGSLALQEKYPQDSFTGLEATAYFPEDGYRVHVLIYGLTAQEFPEIMKARKDIYQLRGLLKERRLAHSIAHATYAGNDKLSIDKLEKLILLFDVFEGINGGSGKVCNRTWMNILGNLTPAKIEEIRKRHDIEPFSSTPWVKGFTAGSDDHSGLFLAKTFTTCDGDTVEEYLESIRSKRTKADGKDNDFASLIFTIYKIGYDFSKSKSKKVARSTLSRFSDLIFENRRLRLRDRIALRTLKYQNRRKVDRAKRMLIDLVDDFRRHGRLPIDRKLDLLFETLAGMSDEFIRLFLRTLQEDLHRGSLLGVFKNLSSCFSGLLLAAPFFATFKHMYKGRMLIDELNARLGQPKKEEEKKVLWFTDTMNDLSGVSFTSHFKNKSLRIATSLEQGEVSEPLGPFIMNLPLIFKFHLSAADAFSLNIPSLLLSLREIYAYDPDEIYISTHGPIGLLGLMIARMLSIKSVGVYHTDYFQSQISAVLNDKSGASMYESYLRWFYSYINEIHLPDTRSMEMFENMGLERGKMKIFKGDFTPSPK